MKGIIFIYCVAILNIFIVAPILHAEDIFDMADRMDKSDFADAVDNVRSCASSNNFSCSESNLSKAKKLARSKKEKQQLADAQNYSYSRKLAYEEEQRRIAEERRLAEQRAQEAAAERSRASSASTPTQSYCSHGDTCFEIIRSERETTSFRPIQIRCTKGRVGNEMCIEQDKATGKWRTGCGISSGGAFYNYNEAGNYNCR